MSQSQLSSRPHPKRQRERLHQIDGLRAAACLMVVFAHSFAKPLAELIAGLGAEWASMLVGRLPASGVELFFVLSGVVLLRPYLRGEKPFDTWRYASRRFLRIYPPYWACLAVSVPLFMLFTAVPTWYSDGLLPRFRWRDVLAQAPLVGASTVTYNAAWWSLEIEVLFYAFVPLIIAAGAGTPFRPWLAVAVGGGLTFASLFACHSIVPLAVREAVPISTSICRFAICFFMGIVNAKTDLSATVATALMVAGLIMLTRVGLTPEDSTAAFAWLYGGFVATVLRPGALQRFFAQPLAVWLGERSYSIFLIHFTVFYVTNYVVSLFVPGRTLSYFLATRLIGLPLAMLAAMVLFELVEKRFAHGLVTADCFWPGTYLARRRREAAGDRAGASASDTAVGGEDAAGATVA